MRTTLIKLKYMHQVSTLEHLELSNDVEKCPKQLAIKLGADFQTQFTALMFRLKELIHCTVVTAST